MTLMNKKQEKRIVEFLFEVGSLRRMPRIHLKNLGKTEDSVADHSFRVAIIGYILAHLEGVNADRVFKMCMFHDIPESRTGDRNWVHKKFVKVNLPQAIKAQLKDLPIEKEISGILKEYSAKKTKESVIAKDADTLEQIFQLKEYADQGNKEAERWIPENVKNLKSSGAKSLAKLAVGSEVHDWWWKQW